MTISKNRKELTGKPRQRQRVAPYLLNRISHCHYQTLQAGLRAVGLTVVPMRTVAVLAVHGELTVKELRVHAIVKQPAKSRVPERDGLVVRGVSMIDQRARRNRLTEEGRRVFDDIWSAMDQARDFLLHALNAWEREELVRLQSGVLRQIRRHPDGPTGHLTAFRSNENVCPNGCYQAVPLRGRGRECPAIKACTGVCSSAQV